MTADRGFDRNVSKLPRWVQNRLAVLEAERDTALQELASARETATAVPLDVLCLFLGHITDDVARTTALYVSGANGLAADFRRSIDNLGKPNARAWDLYDPLNPSQNLRDLLGARYRREMLDDLIGGHLPSYGLANAIATALSVDPAAVASILRDGTLAFKSEHIRERLLALPKLRGVAL